MKKIVTLNDLPRYSHWPARLMGIDKWEQRKKNPKEINREYEHEKWGPLLERVKQTGGKVTIDEVNEWQLDCLSDMLCAKGLHALDILGPAEAYLCYMELVENTLRKYLPATALVELGAGYGSIILPLAKKHPFSGTNIIAGEYTKSGAQLIKTLAKNENLKVSSGRCDFNTEPLTDLSIPEGALFYTSYAICYVPTLDNNHIDRLRSYKPSVVVHFEPCYEHHDPATLLGLMRRRYIEVNDYNINLVSILNQQQKANKIKIIAEQSSVFGNNPFLPISIIVWAPIT